MRSKEEIAADCLRTVDVIEQLLEVVAESGNNPVIITDEDGGEFNLVEINHETGDCAIVIDPRFLRVM